MLSKGEYLRVKGLCETLEDIIKCHFGENWRDKEYESWSIVSNHYINATEDDLILLDLSIALNRLKNVEKSQYSHLLNPDKKLDVGDDKVEE